MTKKNVADLKFIHFETSNPRRYKKHCAAAYELWQTEWKKTFAELGVEKKLYSDDFANRELGGLFIGEEPIGFLLYNFINFTDAYSKDLNYFSSYDQEVLESVAAKGDTILVATYFTSNTDWRKHNTNYSLSEIIVGFVTLRLHFSEADRMVVCLRNGRKINEIFYRHGGRLIKRSRAFNVEVDLSEMDRNSCRLSTETDHALITSKMWLNFYLNKIGEEYEFKRRLKSPENAGAGSYIQRTTLEQ